MITDWPKPSCVKDVRRFLGFASYFRKYIKDLPKLLALYHHFYKVIPTNVATRNAIVNERQKCSIGHQHVIKPLAS